MHTLPLIGAPILAHDERAQDCATADAIANPKYQQSGARKGAIEEEEKGVSADED